MEIHVRFGSWWADQVLQRVKRPNAVWTARKQLYLWETWFLTANRNPTKLLDNQAELGQWRHRSIIQCTRVFWLWPAFQTLYPNWQAFRAQNWPGEGEGKLATRMLQDACRYAAVPPWPYSELRGSVLQRYAVSFLLASRQHLLQLELCHAGSSLVNHMLCCLLWATVIIVSKILP